MSWDSEHFDPLPPTSIEPPPQPQRHWLKRLLAPLSGIALLLWKIAGPLLLALKNVKLFAFSLTFLVSLAAYTSIWGWRFALGFMLLLMVHEMGHVIQLRREGVPASAPMFVSRQPTSLPRRSLLMVAPCTWVHSQTKSGFRN